MNALTLADAAGNCIGCTGISGCVRYAALSLVFDADECRGRLSPMHFGPAISTAWTTTIGGIAL